MPYAARTPGLHLQDQDGHRGAAGQAWGERLRLRHRGDRLLVAFSMSGRRVQIMLLMPPIDDYASTPRNARRTAAAQRSAWEQACRQRWRALLLIIRAKLEAVESGITTLESEFLANVMLPGGGTVRDH